MKMVISGFHARKEGDYRKWYGNHEYVLNWDRGGEEIRNFKNDDGKLRSRPQNVDYFFKGGATWSSVTTSNLSMRIFPQGFAFESKGSVCFPKQSTDKNSFLALMNSSVISDVLNVIAPTVDYSEGVIGNLPVCDYQEKKAALLGKECVASAKLDWDTYETSWNFQTSPLITYHSPLATIQETYKTHQAQNHQAITQMKQLEEENNRLFIDAYGLQDELTPDVPIEQITLTVNPFYRYGVKGKEVASGEWRVASKDNSSLTTNHSSLESRFLTDTMKELVSYAIGCMMGRYSLDAPGLIYAHSGGQDFWDVYNGVVSGEWQVASEQENSSLITHHSPLKENNNECQELSRLDCVAEIDGVGRACVQNDAPVSEGRIIRADQSSASCGSVDFIQYSGRSSEEINQRISELHLDSSGLQSGSRNTNTSSDSSELRHIEADSINTGTTGRNIKNAQQSQGQTEVTHHSPLTTHHSFKPDDDGIIPITDTDWFADDACNRLVEFIETAWPREKRDENLRFLAEGLGIKSGEAPVEALRRYLSKDFFKDHLKTYKKRPIYWLFSSGKTKAFECLVYLHRYNEGTLTRMRVDYVQPLLGKYESRIKLLQDNIASASSTSARKKLEKELTLRQNQQLELRKYDEQLRHYTDQRITLDLDDGVKVNYGKFGTLLANVKDVTGKKV